MFTLYTRTSTGLVPPKLPICVGVVERQTHCSIDGLLAARRLVFLARYSDGIRRDGGSLGTSISNFRVVLHHVPLFDVVFFK